MTKQKFLNEMNELLELDPGTLAGQEHLDDLDAWDSMAVVSFIAMADEQTGVTLSPGKITACSTIDDLYELVTISEPQPA